MPSEFGGFRKVTSEILKKRENEKNTYLGMPVVKEKTKENYQEYLKSEHWKNLRDKKKKKFKVKKRKCGICRITLCH